MIVNGGVGSDFVDNGGIFLFRVSEEDGKGGRVESHVEEVGRGALDGVGDGGLSSVCHDD